MRKMVAGLILAAAFWAGFAGVPDSVVEAQAGGLAPCGTQTTCGGGSDCAPLPTSLHPVDTDCFNQECPWEASNGKCGSKNCWLIFRCGCGEVLTGGVCPSWV